MRRTVETKRTGMFSLCVCVCVIFLEEQSHYDWLKIRGMGSLHKPIKHDVGVAAVDKLMHILMMEGETG